MDNNKLQSFRLDDVLITPSRNEIESNGKTISLRPKVMEVLHYLACHHNRVISKDELIENLWRGRVVTDGSVQKSVNLLRKSLAEASGRTDLIVHYSKKGYQLQVKPVFLATEETPASAVARPGLLSMPVAYRKYSMAVLIVMATGLAGTWLLSNPGFLYGQSLRTQFNSIVGYTSEHGHERAGEPHPNNTHVAYIRENTGSGPSLGSVSTLVVRDSSGFDWKVADTKGAWVDLAWSPSGTSLVAVEIPNEKGRLPRRVLYAKPNALYDIHVFTLDLETNRVLEKHRLSKWQGQISSVTWWNEGTIELVAKQGITSSHRRYRYDLRSQRLTVVPTLDFIANLSQSKVKNGRALLTSRHNDATKLDFIASDQTLLHSVSLENPALDASWLPDGSGALVYSQADKRLSVVYLDGETADIQVPDTSGIALSRPRYSADGKMIYFTGEKPKGNLWQYALSDGDLNLTQNDHLNYLATFSPTGDSIAYVSVRNRQHQIWIIDSSDNDEKVWNEYQVARDDSAADRITSLTWTEDGEYLIYSVGQKIHVYGLSTNASEQILEVGSNGIPLAYMLPENKLLIMKDMAEASNLWLVNLASKEQTQLTFGSVGTAFPYNGKIYFQYIGQDGLWVRYRDTGDLVLASEDFQKDSTILRIDEQGIYYTSGGACRQNSVLYTDFELASAKVVLAMGDKQVSTSSFHPEHGALYIRCQLPESDILVLK